MNSRGIGLISTLLLTTLIAAFLAAVSLLLSQERARVRDSRRIVDMIRLQYAFETLYREQASYADASIGCSQQGVLVATCSLATYLPQIASLKDPGRFQYRVLRVPDDQDYGISFRLERPYENLSRGNHVLSKAGIQ